MYYEVGKCIGQGGCSEVFVWGNDKVIKLFRVNTNNYAVNREFQNSLAAWRCGLPVPRPYRQVDIEGRPGIIFEKINGETLKDRFTDQLYGYKDFGMSVTTVDKVQLDYEDNDVRKIARMLFEIHGKSIPGILPVQKDSLKGSISWPEYLTGAERQVICEYLDSLPEKSCLCHGDPNPNNIIMRDGQLVIIDWMNATAGNPAADLAEFIIMFKYAVLPDETPDFVVDYFNAVREIVNDIFLDEYMELSGMEYEEIDAWILPVAARKLSADAISEEEKSILVDVIRQRLHRLKY